MKANIQTTIGVVAASSVAAWFVVTPSEGSPLWNSPQILTGLIFVALLTLGAFVAKLSRVELMVGGVLLVILLQASIYPVSRFLRSLDQFKTTPSPSLALPSPRSNITAKCSVDGFGNIGCSFSNFGSAKGSHCVVVKFVNHSRAYDFKGITSDEFCSGLVEVSDVRDRKGVLTFLGENGRRITPVEYCRREYGSWPYDCAMELLPAPSVR